MINNKQFFFSVIIFILILYSCNTEMKTNSSNKIYLDLIDKEYNKIFNNIDFSYKLDTTIFNNRKNEVKDMKVFFCKIRMKINNNETINEEIKNEFKRLMISIGLKDKDVSNYFFILDKGLSHKDLNSIYFLELLTLENYKDFYNYIFYSAARIEPIVLPQRSSIKLGEEYRCDIYLACLNGFDFIGTVNNKKLKNEGDIPVFKVRPDSKGKKNYKGNLGMRWNFLNKDTLYYPFEISFEVN